MTKQNSFSIRNYENELATIFPIGMGEFYTVAWDNDAPDTTIYSKQQVDSAFEKGSWQKIEESLPRTFRFKTSGCTEHDQKTYTYVESDCDYNVFWDDHKVRYELQEIREYIADGGWVVLPSEPEKKPLGIPTLPLKIEVDNTKANAMLSETIELAEKLEVTIKNLKKVLGEGEFVTLNIEGLF